MGIIKAIITNHVLIAPVVAWAISQVLKTVLYVVTEKKIDIKRIVGDGGMPSAHSATVVTLAIMAGYKDGFGSAMFAVAIVFAAVVIRDAVGVRREVGKQARIINELYTKQNEGKESLDIEEANELKFISGHSMLEVIMGIFMGIAVSVIYIIIAF